MPWDNKRNTLLLTATELEEIEQVALPFAFRCTKNSFNYVLAIKHDSYGYAKREYGLFHVGLTKDAVGTIINTIKDMKAELGYREAQGPSPSFVIEDEIPDSTRAAKPVLKHPQCPEHGNLLFPIEEGVFQCPVPLCKRRLRKKADTEASKPEVLAVADPESDNPLKMFDDLPPDEKQKVIEDSINRQIADQQSKNVDAPQVTSCGFHPNDERPVYVVKGDRSYLVQKSKHGDVWIDLTSLAPKWEIFQDKSGLKDSTINIYGAEIRFQ